MKNNGTVWPKYIDAVAYEGDKRIQEIPGLVKRTRSKLLYSMLWAVVFSMVFGLHVPLQSVFAELVDRIVALVNDDIVLLSELDQAMAPIDKQIAQQGFAGHERSKMLAEQRAKMLEQMIYEKLTDQRIQRYGIEIDDQEVSATIARIKETNRLSDERFRQALAMEGMTYDAYRRKVKEQLKRTKLVNYEVRSKIVITEKDIETYYADNTARYQGNTKYHLRHILVKVDSDAGELERAKGFQRVQAVYKQLQQGEPFAKMAGIHSDAPTSKEGGDLGVFEVSYLTDKARKALAGLEKGQFSSVVETEQGYQIYFVEDTISTTGISLDDVRSEIEDKLYAEQVDQKYRAWIETLRQRAHIQIME